MRNVLVMGVLHEQIMQMVHFISVSQMWLSAGQESVVVNKMLMILIFYYFFFPPPESSFVAGLSEKQVINLVWPYFRITTPLGLPFYKLHTAHPECLNGIKTKNYSIRIYACLRYKLSSFNILVLATFVCLSVCESGRSREAIRAELKTYYFLFIAGLGRYMRQSTDTAGNGTSRRLMK